MANVKNKSRASRWADACRAADKALSDLRDVQMEYEDWRTNLPENLDSSVLADKLDAVIEIDIQDAMDMISEAEGLDLPQGFGRD